MALKAAEAASSGHGDDEGGAVLGDERAELEALRTAMDTMAPLLEKVGST